MCQNCIGKVLEMGQQIWFSRLRSEVVHHIVDYCNELTELCIIFCLDEDSIDYCVNHLSPKLEKLSLLANHGGLRRET